MPTLSGSREAARKLSSVPDADGPTRPSEAAMAASDPPAKKAAPAKKAVAKKAAAPAPRPAPEPAAPSSLLGGAQPLIDTEDFLNVLYYGIEGTWKTSHACSMAKLSDAPTYVINAEGGLKQGPLRRLGIPVEKIQVLPNKAAGQELTFDLLEGLFWEAKAQLEKEPGSINGFVWDSITEIHKKLLENITGEKVELAASLGQERDRWFIDRSDWGTMSDQVRMLLRRFRDLPCHFVCTALERRDVDDDGNVKYVPAITPALQTDLLGFVDIVCHTTVEEVGKEDLGVGSFRPIGKYRGKDRFQIVPRRLAVPSFERVFGYVNESLTPGTDEVQAAVRAARRKAAASEQAAG